MIKDELQKSIVRARREMPELLGYTTVTPFRFIDQVEERSSLLIQAGLEKIGNCHLVPTYEFSHLGFQEYLTAKAIAELWIPESDGDNSVKILIQHINDEHWREIIPMAAVLLGLQTRPLIECLIDQSLLILQKNRRTNLSLSILQENKQTVLAPLCLANCIANEVPMNQEFKMCIRLADLWVNRDMSYGMQRMVSWGIVSVCMPSFQRDMLQGITGLEERIEKCYSNPKNGYNEWAAIYLGILLELWDKEETKNKIKEKNHIMQYLIRDFYSIEDLVFLRRCM